LFGKMISVQSQLCTLGVKGCNKITNVVIKERTKLSDLPLLIAHTHTTLFTKAWQIQNIDISVRKEKYIYTNKKIDVK